MTEVGYLHPNVPLMRLTAAPYLLFRIPAKSRFVDHLTISKKTISELSCSLIVNTPPSLIVRQIVHY